MKWTLLPPTAALALLIVGAASPAEAGQCVAPSDPLELIPSTAVAVGSVDVTAVTRSQLYRDHRADIENNADVAPVIGALKRCGIPWSSFDRFTAGLGPKDELAVVVEAPGVGRKSTLECVARELPASSKGATVKVRGRGCGAKIEVDGEVVGFKVDSSTIVMVEDGWAPVVRDRLHGQGLPITGAGLGAGISRADRGRPLWFAGLLDANAKRSFSNSSAAKLDRFVGSIDLARGFQLSLLGEADSANAARALRDELGGYLAMGRTMLSTLQLPPDFLDSVTIDSRGHTVTLDAALTLGDLERLEAAARASGL